MTLQNSIYIRKQILHIYALLRHNSTTTQKRNKAEKRSLVLIKKVEKEITPRASSRNTHSRKTAAAAVERACMRNAYSPSGCTLEETRLRLLSLARSCRSFAWVMWRLFYCHLYARAGRRRVWRGLEYRERGKYHLMAMRKLDSIQSVN